MLHLKLLAGAAIASIALPSIAAADNRYANDHYRQDRYGHQRTVDARVVHVEPLYSYVRVGHPQRECWNEEVYYDGTDRRDLRRHGSPGAVLAGGIIGGIIGHQFGSGRGNDIATVAGAVIGSTIAHNASERNGERYDSYPDHDRTRTVRRCETRASHHRERQVDGYRVTYVYQGHRNTIRMPYDPGRTVAVRVSVTPVGG